MVKPSAACLTVPYYCGSATCHYGNYDDNVKYRVRARWVGGWLGDRRDTYHTSFRRTIVPRITISPVATRARLPGSGVDATLVLNVMLLVARSDRESIFAYRPKYLATPPMPDDDVQETKLGVSAVWHKRPQGWQIIYAHEPSVNQPTR